MIRSTQSVSHDSATAPTFGAVRLSAMNLLAHREHSQEELRQKLERRFSVQALIEQVLLQLADEGLQSDQRFAEAFVTQRIRQGKGPVRIRQELQQKGIVADLILSALDPYQDEWFSLATETRARRFGDSLPESPKDKARQMRFLQYRGYTTEQIRRALASP